MVRFWIGEKALENLVSMLGTHEDVVGAVYSFNDASNDKIPGETFNCLIQLQTFIPYLYCWLYATTNSSSPSSISFQDFHRLDSNSTKLRLRRIQWLG